MSIIADNYKKISDNVRDATIKSGRNEGDVELIAVTKFVDVARIKEVFGAGAKSVGENRAQEMRDKLDFFNCYGARVHLIGQLQTNKVKYAVGKVVLIQSVDREPLASEINRLALRENIVQNILVEVNIGNEEQKGGIFVDRLDEFFHGVSQMHGICVKGLMCIPPAVGEVEAHKYFAKMKKLFDSYKQNDYPNVTMEQLSMGMSGDYLAAIAEGATMVRVGTAIFGARCTHNG